MKAVILVGGEGTRLRPLTLSTPKPVAPVVDRPFLRHQLDMLARAGVDEVVFSVAYQPAKVRAVFGEGSPEMRIRYAVEETPLGTGGAVKNAESQLDDLTIVLNGDVLTDVDVGAVVQQHRARDADATLVLYPVANPSAYGLVEFDAEGRVQRFLEKPGPGEITTDTINAGIYVLRTATLELMPAGVPYSIERGFFPALLARGDRVFGHVHRGYWIDIGTPERYLEVHRDILRQRFAVPLSGERGPAGWVDPTARVDPAAQLTPPCYLGPEVTVAAGAQLGPDVSLGRGVEIAADASVRDAVLWSGARVGAGAVVEGALVGPGVVVGEHARVRPGAALGEGTVLSPYTRF